MQVITIHSTLDLVYSPDDGGWYFEDSDTDLTSKIYATKSEAITDLQADAIIWNK